MKKILTLLLHLSITLTLFAQTTDSSQGLSAEEITNINPFTNSIAPINQTSSNVISPNSSNNTSMVDFDFDCNTDFFTIDEFGSIQKWSMINNIVTGGDIILVAPGSSLSYVGYPDDPTFWTTQFPGYTFSYYDEANSNWINMTSEEQILNNGGHGADQYYMTVFSNGDRGILHYDGTDFTTLDTSPTYYGVADIAVDNQGRAWVVKKGLGGNSDSLIVLDNTGLIESYEIDDWGLGHYGSFFLNNTLYIGHSSSNSIIPVVLNGNTAEQGTPIDFPNQNFYDFASCQDLEGCLNSSSNLTVTSCDAYTSPNSNDTWTNSGVYNDTLTNSAGCDSIITTDLTIVYSNSGTDNITSCIAYTWIDGNTYNLSNNTATYNLVNSSGCDSVVTLNLTIPTVELSTSNDGMTITSNAIDATYQWLDCDDSYAIIPGETNQSFTATNNGNYAVEVTQNSCVDTTECTSIITNSTYGNYLDNEISIFPNPTNRNTFIEFSEIQENIKVELLSILGQRIETSIAKNTKLFEVEINQPTGLYLIRVTGKHGKQVVFKVLKK